MVDDNKNNTPAVPESGIEVIPQEFYGGMKRQVQTRIEKVYVSPQALVAAKQAPAAPAIGISQMPARSVSSVPPAPLARGVGAKLQEPKIIILAVSGLLVLVVAGAAFYYIRQAQQAKKLLAPATPQPVAQTSAVQTPTTPLVVVPASTPEASPPTDGPVALAPPQIILPQKNYTTSADTDNDGLTDEEERLFGATASKPDTDDDGYPDALEITNLYNPLGFRPERLFDSGFIANYFNPTRQYSIYYPRGWVAQALDPVSEEVMFSSDTGEFMEIMSTANSQKLPVKDWYLSQSPGARAEDLDTIKTKEGVEGALSPDGLTAYVPFGETIYIITYNIGLKTEVNFLSTFKMMTTSFKTIGSQEVVASPPAAPPPTETTTTP